MSIQAVVVALAVSLAFPAGGTEAQSGSAPRVRQVKYVDGDATWERGTRLVVTLGQEILLRDTKAGGAALAIPARNIRGVLYDNKAWRASSAVWRVMEWSTEEGNLTDDYFGNLAMITTVLGGLAILPFAHAIQGKKHYVHLQWREGEADRLLVLQVDAEDRLAFLAELQQISGAAWVDLPRQREEFRRELEREKHNAIRIKLDRSVRLGQNELSPGRYQLVLLPRGPARAEAAFFMGRVRHDKVVATAHVEVERGATGRAGAEVYYHGRASGRTPTLGLIVTPHERVRFFEPASVAASMFP